MKIYPLRLYNPLSFKNDKELVCINNFFNTKQIQNKSYNVVVWVKGNEEKQVGIIPIGVPYEISLQYGNITKYSKNIENIFDFEINEHDLYNKCLKISEWLEKFKN